MIIFCCILFGFLFSINLLFTCNNILSSLLHFPLYIFFFITFGISNGTDSLASALTSGWALIAFDFWLPLPPTPSHCHSHLPPNAHATAKILPFTVSNRDPIEERRAASWLPQQCKHKVKAMPETKVKSIRVRPSCLHLSRA